jgi:hypothetical protein
VLRAGASVMPVHVDWQSPCSFIIFLQCMHIVLTHEVACSLDQTINCISVTSIVLARSDPNGDSVLNLEILALHEVVPRW